eukprot:COSAG01_NODE_15605_length_1320_cov_1.359541_1_plen_254_part_10
MARPPSAHPIVPTEPVQPHMIAPTPVTRTRTIATETGLGNVTASLKPKQRKGCRTPGCGTLSSCKMTMYHILASMVVSAVMCAIMVRVEKNNSKRDPAPTAMVGVTVGSLPTAANPASTDQTVTVVGVPAPTPQMDLAQRMQGGTDTAPTVVQVVPVETMAPPLAVATATPMGAASTPALMDLEQITPLSLALTERDKITQARIAVPTALAARGLQLEQWTQICDEFDRLLDLNFFVDCPNMEGVYWCCPLGPL